MTPETVIEFRRRWLRVLIGLALPVIPFLIGPSLDVQIDGSEMPEEGWHLIALAGLAVWFVLFFLNWRCPACGEAPLLHWRPAYCDHCGVPLLIVPSRDRENPHPMTREEWRAEQRNRIRQYDVVEAGKWGQGVLLVVWAPFFFGIVMGIGGCGINPDSELALEQGPDAPRWAAIGLAVLFSLLGLLMLRHCRRRFEDFGFSPEEVRQRIAGMWVIAGVLILLTGMIALAVALFPIYLPELARDLNLDPIENARPLAFAFALYTLAGVAVLLKSWGTWNLGRGLR